MGLILLIGTLLVFIADSIGNALSFSNRITNALTTAVIWGILFVILFFVLPMVQPGVTLAQSMPELLERVALGVGLVFIADMIGNAVAFGSRFFNALVTAVVWAGLFFAIYSYALPMLLG